MYILDRILMADDLPNKYFAPVLLEMFALAFFFACVDAIVAGKSWRSWSGSLVVALVLSSCGFKWPWVKEKIAGLSVRTKIADWLESLARRINPAVLSQDKRTGTLTTTLNKAGARLSFDVVGDCSMSDDPAGPWKMVTVTGLERTSIHLRLDILMRLMEWIGGFVLKDTKIWA